MKKSFLFLLAFIATLFCHSQNVYYGEPYKDAVDTTKDYLVFFEGDYEVYTTPTDLFDAKKVGNEYCIAYIDHKTETFCICVPYHDGSEFASDSLFTVYEFNYDGMKWGNNWIPIYYATTIYGEMYASFAVMEQGDLFTIVISYKEPFANTERTIWIGRFVIEDELD